MSRLVWMSVAGACLVAGLGFSHPARAQVEIAGPDGRRILLFDNGTWRYTEATQANPADGKEKQEGEAVLTLLQKTERGTNCRFELQLVNNLPYEIRSLVPYFSAYRANGTIYDTVSAASSFAAMKPGDTLRRQLEVVGLPCGDIARLQVVGGDRCSMGDLDKFNATDGQCLARVRVVASDLVRFDK